MRFIVVIAGPTAVGKTDLSLKLARRIGGEIVSADSMQVYRGLDVGTDKVSPEKSGGIKHYLIDVREPYESFSVADFVREADRAIREIWRRGKIPIIVGGTGFYIDALLYGIPPLPPRSEAFRRKLEGKSTEELFSLLRKVDPEYAERINRNDRRRIVRALEVYELTGKPLSHFQRKGERRYRFLAYFIYRNRDELYRRIEDRVDFQIRRGLVEEAKRLLRFGKGITAFQALGYKEMLEYIEGRMTFDEAVRLLKRRTKEFARRQFTWFRKRPEFKWINLSEVGEEGAIRIIEKDIEKMKGEERDEASGCLPQQVEEGEGSGQHIPR